MADWVLVRDDSTACYFWRSDRLDRSRWDKPPINAAWSARRDAYGNASAPASSSLSSARAAAVVPLERARCRGRVRPLERGRRSGTFVRRRIAAARP